MAAAPLTLIPLATASATAPAGTGGISCSDGSLSLRSNPGITRSKQSVHLLGYGDLGPCTSAEHPEITTGVAHVETTLEAECPAPFGPGNAKVTINWNDGSTSVISGATFRGDTHSFTLEGGSVTSGPFLGGTPRATGLTTTSWLELSVACVTTGITSYRPSIDEFTLGEL
ncbi:hypothetical protein DEJ45_11775 [Streptomyces venezuelae]|nr:hypothetical protein DEJ45_11775 [Streptomyces venezuelae]